MKSTYHYFSFNEIWWEPFSAVWIATEASKGAFFTKSCALSLKHTYSIRSEAKTHVSEREKKIAARAPLATTSNLYYRTFTYKEKKRKPTLNWSHIPTFNLHLFCPAWAWFIYASRGTRENFRNQISCRFRRVMIETSFPLFP